MKQLIAISEIIAEAGLGTPGVDLFVGTIPGDVASGIMVRPPLNPAEIDEGMDGHIDETIIVIVRDPDMAEGYARAKALMSALKKIEHRQGDIYFSWIRPESMPVSYPRGDGDEIETSLRVQIGWADTA